MRKGYSLLELLVAISIFGIVSTITTNAYITSFKAEQRSQLQNSIMLDAKYIMDLLTEEIQTGSIDYEEYFNQCVINGTCPQDDLLENIPDDIVDQETKIFGNNFGIYDWQFFYSGTTTPTSNDIDGYGDRCQQDTGGGATIYLRIPDVDCDTGALPFAEDAPTGVNPQTFVEDPNEQSLIDSRKESASAFCATTYQNFDGTDGVSNKTCPAGALSLDNFTFNELYLINKDQNKKTIIGREQITDSDYAVSLIRLTEKEDPGSENNVYPIKIFECESGYECTNTTNNGTFIDGVPDNYQLNTPNRFDFYNYLNGKNIFKDFVPISPLKVNVKRLSFLIAPLDNPSLAYRESIQIYPQVTIILEVEPSNTFRLPFFSKNFNLKLQKTVSTYSADTADIN
jgi:prepilin-type N-terminal cleavage/methylation domain-containing protein